MQEQEATYRKYSKDAMDIAFKGGFEQGFNLALKRICEESEKDPSLQIEEVVQIVRDSNKACASNSTTHH